MNKDLKDLYEQLRGEGHEPVIRAGQLRNKLDELIGSAPAELVTKMEANDSRFLLTARLSVVAKRGRLLLEKSGDFPLDSFEEIPVDVAISVLVDTKMTADSLEAIWINEVRKLVDGSS